MGSDCSLRKWPQLPKDRIVGEWHDDSHMSLDTRPYWPTVATWELRNVRPHQNSAHTSQPSEVSMFHKTLLPCTCQSEEISVRKWPANHTLVDQNSIPQSGYCYSFLSVHTADKELAAQYRDLSKLSGIQGSIYSLSDIDIG